LANASEALGIEGRRGARQYTSLVPLDRFVDAVEPESASVRRLEQAVRAGDVDELRVAFVEWAGNDARLKAAGELAGLSKNLSTLGAIGLQALEVLQSGRAPAEGWVAEKIQEVEGMEKPQAEVTLAAARPVRMLLDAIARKKLNN
jgi:hexosaminidase